MPAYLNLPVLSFLFLRGRSRCCQAKLSPFYLACELAGLAAGLLAALFYGRVGLLALGAAGLLLILTATAWSWSVRSEAEEGGE